MSHPPKGLGEKRDSTVIFLVAYILIAALPFVMRWLVSNPSQRYG